MTSLRTDRPARSRNVFRVVVIALAAYGAWYLSTDVWRAVRVDAAPRPVVPRRELMPEEQAVIGLFEAAKGSVVFISTQERVVDYWTRNVMTVPRGTGSGFIWDEQGHVITNLHVVQGGSGAVVKLADGRDFEATFVGASAAHDIAVLKIQTPQDAPAPIPVGTSEDVQVGQKVFAIGNPFGLDWTLTTGIVSALDRSLTGEDARVIQHLIQTDAAINPGNSGGPLLDSAGRLIGMNTAIFSPSGASAGIGFAVPVDTINRVAPELIANGSYQPPSLGIDVDDVLSRAVARQLGVSGAAIFRVAPGGVGDRAGLRGVRRGARGSIVPGDVIIGIDGKAVDSGALLAARLDDYKPGDTVKLRVWREGKEIDVAAELQQGE
jgi:S1-C subfamily serine protease